MPSPWVAVRNALLALAYVGFIFWIGANPAMGMGGSNPVTRLITNLYHVPLYAGLGFWVLQMVSRGEGLTNDARRRAIQTFALAGAMAVLDEVYQVFIPFRNASLTDLVLDFAGIAAIVAVYAVGARESKRIQGSAASGQG